MQSLSQTHKTLTVVNDQHGRPTWTRTLVEFMTYLTDNQKEYGYYHLSNDAAEDTTCCDLAVEILKDSDVEVIPVNPCKFQQVSCQGQTSPQLNHEFGQSEGALKEFYKQEIRK